MHPTAQLFLGTLSDFGGSLGARNEHPSGSSKIRDARGETELMTESKRSWGKVRQVQPSGRYQASYIHGGVWGVTKGVRFTALSTFDTRGDAWAWLGRERELIERGTWTPPFERYQQFEEERAEAERARRAAEAMPTVESYGRQYVDRDDLAGASRERYKQILKYYILGEPATSNRRGMTKGKPVITYGLGDIRITELTRAEVRAWWQSLPVKTRESSCRQAYDLLRAIMNAALEDELIDVNPVKVKAAAQAQVSRERNLPPLSIPVLYLVADAMPERLRLGVLLGGVLGMRSGEVRALQRRDFQLSANPPTVTVSRSVKEAEGKLEIGPVKTARRGIATRTLVIPAVLVDAIRAHLREHTQIRRSGLLFWRASDGGPVRSAAWLKAFKRACNQVATDLEAEEAMQIAAGEPETDESQRVRELLTDHGGYIFHGTRVTGLTWSYRLSGGNLKAVQAIGGHTSSKTALRYQRADVDYLAAIAESLSAMTENGANP
ncbi:MAG: tyrosine-type recombinase/integrase [Propionibacteriaceae bacterium]|jgi:integrase|nr:tyrosine-type recombinase/integrase [Propionibacteriaceae bacterium]